MGGYLQGNNMMIIAHWSTKIIHAHNRTHQIVSYRNPARQGGDFQEK